MIDKEQSAKTLKLIVQNAWRLDTGNTTLNSMIEWILREYMEQVVMPVLEVVDHELEALNNDVQLLEKRIMELEENGQNGGIQKPKRNSATKAKVGNGSATEARA